ncbi:MULTISPECIES: 16S rRNA (guanine(527)-N(7))-methyltransferase RsmG [unclassified Megasphaera]|jgi:16S rRNA (guanine527-N7)-methyltransferase|uniref:16S rRNA (guanine(527)-N(7))-methyltransferase RsmG n=1 Tax=unclassified Megasphaera TaxID=2626256 RepID=UPI000EC96E79|nr:MULTISPECIES: 16S rRNA (guanine(527)-N(7))-methyltransferase RsmG [unclassified Megasphaera]MDY2903906.1 16S rRNA (guanine(527)-N(7))-methyltransferase RsmG [Caecibacter massiliensis]HAM04337.1 16S rRNA (guanine(527)-N(7))-methyltransferase RsmG [Megasphaera sp.]
MFQNDLIHAMEAMGLVLEDYQIRQFCRFEELLLETNKVMNLTAITDPGEVAVKHMADSLSCYDERYFPKDASLLDLGTGAGFPGIPLAIFRPDLTVTFFDSLQKRLNFLNEVCRETGLRKVAFLHGRAEEMAHQEAYREQFDLVTSRAVARLSILCEWALPYVRNNGLFIALKGAQYEEEIKEASNALRILGGTLEEVRPVTLPGLSDKRAVLYIRKSGTSPAKYPRKPKMAAKHPL